MTLFLHRLEQLDDPLLLPFLDLYESAFPPNERQPVSEFLALLHAHTRGEAPVKHLRVALDTDDNGAFVGLAVYDTRPDCGAAFLHFFAVAPEKRNGGLGARLFQTVCDEIRQAVPEALLLVFEVEPAHFAPDSAAQQFAVRRIGFYRRLGARILSGGVHYAITVPFWPTPTPLLLGFYSLRPNKVPLSPADALAIARCLLPASCFAPSGDPLALT